MLPLLQQEYQPLFRMDGIDGSMKVYVATHYGRACHMRTCSSITRDSKDTRETTLCQALEADYAPCHKCMHNTFEMLMAQNAEDKMFKTRKRR